MTIIRFNQVLWKIKFIFIQYSFLRNYCICFDFVNLAEIIIFYSTSFFLYDFIPVYVQTHDLLLPT